MDYASIDSPSWSYFASFLRHPMLLMSCAHLNGNRTLVVALLSGLL